MLLSHMQGALGGCLGICGILPGLPESLDSGTCSCPITARRAKADNCVCPENVCVWRGRNGQRGREGGQVFDVKIGKRDQEKRAVLFKMNLVPVDWREGFWAQSSVLTLTAP